MNLTATALIGALVYAFTNFLRYLSASQWRSALTQAVVWAGGIGGVWLFAVSQLGGQVHVGSLTLAQLDGPTKLLAGFLASSLFSFGHDVKTAIDQHQSAAVPPLTLSRPAPPPLPAKKGR